MKRPIIIVLLILALALVGTGVLAVAFFTLGRPAIESIRPVVYATTEETKSLEVEGPFTLSVQDDAGKVSIVGSETDKVTVDIVKTGVGSSQERAQQSLKNIKYEIKQQGDVIKLIYDLPERQLRDLNSVGTVDFLVTVPSDVNVEVNAGFGNIELEDLAGAVDVKTESGTVEASSINAAREDIRLESSFGSIRLTNATGANISLSSNSGTLEAENVRASQDVELSTDFGNVVYEKGSASSLTISTNSGAVDLVSVNVSNALVVKDEFGNINLDRVNARSYDTQTNSGSITIDGAKGSVEAQSGFGNITVTNAENATINLHTESGAIDFEGSLGEGPHQIGSNFGEIEVSIPADSALNVDLQTNFGTIKSDIPITVTLSGESEKNHQTGTINDGGPQLTVETESGGISIQASR
ncbi:MAG TPA: DUF4097 family beta strand repeat-containing protein [Anaerolineales bacterium]|nr:DUF4097 family beta strand repeat-containing protein [Anaerolineales bacterium]